MSIFFSELIKKVYSKVEEEFLNHPTDHDFQHIVRVYKMALVLQKLEGGNKEVIALAALLHDISDHKLNGGIINDNGRVAEAILIKLDASKEIVEKVIEIVDKVSFKGANVDDEAGSLELKIVRDADRLDAIGAIGIARAFSFGGFRNRKMYDDQHSHELHNNFNDYLKSDSNTINHFYEKLLLLSDRMETNSAKKEAKIRHEFMQQFLDQFLKEWNVGNELNN